MVAETREGGWLEHHTPDRLEREVDGVPVQTGGAACQVAGSGAAYVSAVRRLISGAAVGIPR